LFEPKKTTAGPHDFVNEDLILSGKNGSNEVSLRNGLEGV